MNKSLAFLKKLARGLAKAIFALIAIVVIYAAYGIYAEKVASGKAASICASVSPGDDTLGLRDKAIADGASEFQTRWFESDGTDTLFITYVGLPPFSRHVCHITARNGRVVSADLTDSD